MNLPHYSAAQVHRRSFPLLENSPEIDRLRGKFQSELLVKLTCVNGDVWEGFVEFVDDEHQDVIFQACSGPEKYDTRSCYAIAWDEIVDFQQLAD